MAEFALSGVLQLYKRSRYFAENQRLRRWEKHRGLLELAGKTVCILGCGSVGTECAKRFRAFDCWVVGVARSSRENPDYDEILPMEMLDTVLSRSDVIVLTLPLTEDTRHLMDRSRFAAMKPDSILVNIARGAVVDTDALISALEGHLGGAVLDVFEEEPLQENSPLWDMDHVVLTPHNSFVGEGNSDRLAGCILENLERYT
jgi:phosphoglycerate dehydrogenase-like enzyme